MFEITRYEGIKGLGRFVWTMQKTGRLHLGTILLGLVTVVFGIIGCSVTGSCFALVFLALGAYLVGTADGRFCVCDSDACDHPRSMYADLYPEDRPAVKPDGTVITPHDEMYRRPVEGEGFEIVT